MQAITVSPPTPGARLEQVEPPALADGEIRVRVIECGICGTDRDIVAGKYGSPAEGRSSLILGHENLGTVAELEGGVTGFSVGDVVVATVRRGCGICRFCLSNRSDFCETGKFTERGVRGQDGFLAECYVERPEYVVRVPPSLRAVAVLLEPFSVVAKAFEQSVRLLDRLGPTPASPREQPLQALVTGTGAIAILAALLLRSEGYAVTAVDRRESHTPAGRLLESIGAQHVNVATGFSALGALRFDLVFEASGSAELNLELPRWLRPNGAVVYTGIPPVDAPPISFAPGPLFRDLVLSNQALVGSVNANRTYFESGIRYFDRFEKLFPGATAGIITARRPLEEFGEVLTNRAPDSIKTVLTLPTNEPSPRNVL
jgi:glucose 1-dehydrogenase